MVWVSRRAWRRFRGDRLGFAGGVSLGLIGVTMILLLPFSTSWFNVQDLHGAVRANPTIAMPTSYDVYSVSLSESLLGSRFVGFGSMMHSVAGVFGFDDLGRSVFFRVGLGWVISMMIGAGAAVMATVIGVGWGTVSGLAGGAIDQLMMRIVDILYGLPYVLFVVLLRVVLADPMTDWLGGRSQLAGVVLVVLAIGSVSWLTMARVVRGQVLSLKTQGFVEAASANGAGSVRIMVRHIFPNVVGVVIVYASLIVPQAILQESFLSFLGIGIQSPLPSLGTLASDGVNAVNAFVGFWWLIVFPCGMLFTTLLAMNFLGDGLRDAFDPRGKCGMVGSG